MAKHPAMLLWTDAYLADTMHLTTLEHGAYLLLLMSMWRTSEKRLPNDDTRLARFARLTPAQWRRIKPTLMAFFDVDGSHITQGRLTDEAEAVKQKRESQKTKAHAKWLKYRRARDAAAAARQCRNDASLNPEPLSHEEEIPPSATETTSLTQTPPKGVNGRSKPISDESRGTRMPEDWRPSDDTVEFCLENIECCTPAVLNQQFPLLKEWALTVTGARSRKRNWDRYFINWIRRACNEIREREARERRWAERRGQAH